MFAKSDEILKYVDGLQCTWRMFLFYKVLALIVVAWVPTSICKEILSQNLDFSEKVFKLITTRHDEWILEY